MKITYPTRLTYRKRGLPKKLREVEGLSAQADIVLDDRDKFAVKTLIFKNRLCMRRFYHTVLPGYREGFGPDKISYDTEGCVTKLSLEEVYFNRDREAVIRAEVDRNYCALVVLSEGLLTAETLCHEACHVGFAWDYRYLGVNQFKDMGEDEENVCYPAGRWLDAVITMIKENGLREI